MTTVGRSPNSRWCIILPVICYLQPRKHLPLINCRFQKLPKSINQINHYLLIINHYFNIHCSQFITTLTTILITDRQLMGSRVCIKPSAVWCENKCCLLLQATIWKLKDIWITKPSHCQRGRVESSNGESCWITALMLFHEQATLQTANINSLP